MQNGYISLDLPKDIAGNTPRERRGNLDAGAQKALAPPGNHGIGIMIFSTNRPSSALTLH